jgi:hypothetical protein
MLTPKGANAASNEKKAAPCTQVLYGAAGVVSRGCDVIYAV